MMCYPPTGYIMFSLKNLKVYGDQRLEAGDQIWGSGAVGRITQTPKYKM